MIEKLKERIKRSNHNKYQIGMRIIVVCVLIFFIAFSFGLELFWNGAR